MTLTPLWPRSVQHGAIPPDRPSTWLADTTHQGAF